MFGWPRTAAVGHLGFTGTSLWLDLARRRWVALLTNRVHPTRTGNADAIKFGARVTWQPTVRLDKLLDRSNQRQIVISARPRQDGNKTEADCVTWVVVPHNDWTTREPWPHKANPIVLPFPAGSAENRLVRRRAEQARLVKTWQDRMLFSQLCAVDWRRFSGAYVARPDTTKGNGEVMLQVIP